MPNSSLQTFTDTLREVGEMYEFMTELAASLQNQLEKHHQESDRISQERTNSMIKEFQETGRNDRQAIYETTDILQGRNKAVEALKQMVEERFQKAEMLLDETMERYIKSVEEYHKEGLDSSQLLRSIDENIADLSEHPDFMEALYQPIANIYNIELDADSINRIPPESLSIAPEAEEAEADMSEVDHSSAPSVEATPTPTPPLSPKRSTTSGLTLDKETIKSIKHYQESVMHWAKACDSFKKTHTGFSSYFGVFGNAYKASEKEEAARAQRAESERALKAICDKKEINFSIVRNDAVLHAINGAQDEGVISILKEFSEKQTALNTAVSQRQSRRS